MAFWIILTGALAAGACGLLGSFLVLRKMSLIGDAISHAVLPGIAIAFLLSSSRSIIPMFFGASAFGLLTAVLIETLSRRWRIQEDASIGIVFTALFAIGVVLISLYAGHIDLDQECVLYGEIAYTPFDTIFWNGLSFGPRPVWLLGFVFVFDLMLILLFYKELLVSSFDPALAKSIGINATLFHYILMTAVSMTTVAAFESVGAILVVAMLIIPGAIAYLLTDNLTFLLALSVIVGIISSAGGYYLAGWWDSSIAGAMTVVAGFLFALAFLFSPKYGLISKLLSRFLLSIQIGVDHILLELYRALEAKKDNQFDFQNLLLFSGGGNLYSRLALVRARQNGFIRSSGKNIYSLTTAGEESAQRLIRGHRLWESFLDKRGIPVDHQHDPAHRMEHFMTANLENRLDENIGKQSTDPMGKKIPKKS